MRQTYLHGDLLPGASLCTLDDVVEALSNTTKLSRCGWHQLHLGIAQESVEFWCGSVNGRCKLYHL